MRVSALFLLLLLLPGCTLTDRVVDTPTLIITPPRVEAAEATTQPAEPITYTVLYESGDVNLAMYEPAAGCYLGALLSPHEYSMKPFERHTGKKHAVFAHTVSLDEDFPETWLLQCIAAQSTPLILLREGEEGFSTLALKGFAQWLGQYNIPMFVAYEPSAKDATTYKMHYRVARALFMDFTPQAAFVWLTGGNGDGFYPGDAAVDWIGLPVLAAWGGEGYAVDIVSTLENLYHSYQNNKPMMLAPAGISHFSEKDYGYRIPDAAASIVNLYATLQTQYPRVKLIAYADVMEGRDDYSISRDADLLQAYKESISSRHYLSALEEGGSAKSWVRSAYDGYYYEGNVYLHTKTENLPPVASVQTVSINGNPCVPAHVLSGHFVVTDHAQGVIYVYGATES